MIPVPKEKTIMNIYNQLIKNLKNGNKYKIALLDPDKKNHKKLNAQLKFIHSNDYCDDYIQ